MGAMAGAKGAEATVGAMEEAVLEVGMAEAA